MGGDDVVEFQGIFRCEIQSTESAFAVLRFEQAGFAFGQLRVVTQVSSPVEPIAVERAFVVLDFGVVSNGRIAVTGKPGAVGGTELPEWCDLPVFGSHPGTGLVGMTKGYPTEQLEKQQVIQSAEGAFGIGGRVVIGPTPNDGIEFVDECLLRYGAQGLNDLFKMM